MDDPVIQTEGLTRCFGSRTVVCDLDLAVPKGCIFGFLGRNGSGKTTTIRMLLGQETRHNSRSVRALRCTVPVAGARRDRDLRVIGRMPAIMDAPRLPMSSTDLILRRLDGSMTAIASLRDQADRIAALGEALIACLNHGGTLYTAGNGGSAAQALHLAEELIGRYRGNRPPLRALCLNADPTAMSCIANDFGYDRVFARQCEALLGSRDVLLVLSTSGKSANLVEALNVARQCATTTAGLLGAGGGTCGPLCDHEITLDETDSAFVQEAHQVVIHLLCEMIEEAN